MPYPKEFPQHLLGVGRAFSMQELLIAMGRRINENPGQVSKYRSARNELTDLRKRLEYEILLPHGHSELEKELEQSLIRLGQNSYLPQTCPKLPVPRILHTAGDVDYEADFSEIPFKPFEISLSLAYDNVRKTRLPVIFDK
jgi:hypothetical protein